jgi:hypothetical protein
MIFTRLKGSIGRFNLARKGSPRKTLLAAAFLSLTLLFSYFPLAPFSPIREDNHIIPAASASGSYAVDHVIFTGKAANLYTDGQWAPYVRPQDSFMLLQNNSGGFANQTSINNLNSRANQIKAKYPNNKVYAATSGLQNVEFIAPRIDKTLFDGVMYVYEPNRVNEPEFTWNSPESDQNMKQAAKLINQAGLEPWGKPSGRWADGRDHYRDSDYGVWANIMADGGQNVQTQGSCRDRDGNGKYTEDFREAVDSIVSQYRTAGASARLIVQVTTSSSAANTNAISPDKAFECAMAGWAYPEVEAVTLWSAIGDQESIDRAEKFLQLRDQAVGNHDVPPTPQPTPAPQPTPTPLPDSTKSFEIPGRIEAEEYKDGDEGVGYHDNDAGNAGGEYRSDDVDIQSTSDNGGGYKVMRTGGGEWLAYDVKVSQSGTYNVTARVASGSDRTKSFHVEVDGQDVTGAVSFNDSQGYDAFVDVKVKNVSLNAGRHELRFVMHTGYFSFNYLDLVLSANTAPSVSIVSPGQDDAFLAGEMIDFSATASDLEDGPLSQSSLVWQSSIDGQLGTGEAFQGPLSAGDHLITLVATDSAGATGTSTVNITVMGIIYGDADEDGQFTGQDVHLVVDWVVGHQPMPQAGTPVFAAADVNGDGEISTGDVGLMIDRLSGKITQFHVEA